MSNRTLPAGRLPLILCVFLGGCPGPGRIAERCEFNSQCATPLVCRLGRCRTECRDQRDCGAGLECVRDTDGLGACQLMEETECVQSSDCPEPLVCHFQRCTNTCQEDVDCPPGSHCIEESLGGGLGCRDESTMQCNTDEECSAPLVCAVDERCRVECLYDWDCAIEQACVDGSCRLETPVVATPSPPLIAASQFHTCGADNADDLRCWGGNDHGEIGNGDFGTNVLVPFEHTLSGVTIVGAGQGHSCAAQGTMLQCWGENEDGQIGLDAAGADVLAPTAVDLLPAGASIVSLALGNGHSCAIVDDTTGNRLFCWGRNDVGQLGLGAADRTSRARPTEVTITDPVEVSTFATHTCVRLATGHVECFGNNDVGQLGDGGSATESGVPVEAVGITDAIQVRAGTRHTCALIRDGTVRCWGANTFGQLGDGTTTPRPTPVPTAPIGALAQQIAVGSVHTCVRTDTDQVLCWGSNLTGQCGQTFAISAVREPTAVLGLGAVLEVAAGSNHTCVHVAPGSFQCFGANEVGQLGDGSMNSSETPQDVTWAPR